MKKDILVKCCSVCLSAVLLFSSEGISTYAQTSAPPPQYPPDQYPSANQYPPPQYPPSPQQPYPRQQPYPPPAPATYAPPRLAPQQLDQLVAPIALYPDPLLAQVLTASTYWNQIPDAANWANQHSYLKGPALADAIQADNLPWDPSVIALLPFPSVLNYMAIYMSWTQALGSAVLAQRDDVMDAVQRMRQQAYSYGYLRSSPYYRVVYTPGDIQIVPMQPDIVYVPVYNPRIVYAPPRPGIAVSAAIGFGVGVVVGAAFQPWGWGHPAIEWPRHVIIIDNHPWERTWANRAVYAHPYPARPPHYEPGPRVERHEVRGPERSHNGDHRRDDRH